MSSLEGREVVAKLRKWVQMKEPTAQKKKNN